MIQAIFPAGVTAMTLNGLHQWDYGRKLQIGAEGIPALVEVHFACPGMTEAIVRVASATDSYTVTIPDRCLEQSAPITAWVVFVDETSSKTVMELTLPITPRPRPMPAVTPDVVQEDRYNELFAAVETALGELDGIVENTKRASENAQGSATSANSSAASATSSAAAATASATAAEGFKNAAGTSASNAAASAESAAGAEERAESAADRAEAAASAVGGRILREDFETPYTGYMAAYDSIPFHRRSKGQMFDALLIDTRTEPKTYYSVGTMRLAGENPIYSPAFNVLENGQIVQYCLMFMRNGDLITCEDDPDDKWVPSWVGLRKITSTGFQAETNDKFFLMLKPLAAAYKK